ncbi:unnamed protein product [Spirodela intermedia]|uniref:Uncharacterized protein n=1 Tax=Spirodela intermedia TaxID=51605 RepID=A0A7I8JM26_SPIIN|nr:unnamed protein product [Spirodela intermedia]CAA6670875.1 unnamed protein product [Spirodela intermedia]
MSTPSASSCWRSSRAGYRERAWRGQPRLESFVRKAFREERALSEIVDPSLLHEVHAKKQVLAVFHVALGCTESDPDTRPRMRAVSQSLDRVSGPP